MRNYKIDLKAEGYRVQGGKLECMLSDCPLDGDGKGWKRPAVIVCPGGAYCFVSKREGEPVANYFSGNGFQAFVLTYLVSVDGENVRYPEQLTELASAIDFVKKHADEYNVNPEEIFVVGFSAGGHLVGDLATEYAKTSEYAGQKLDARPAAVGLAYPVIYYEGHTGSFDNLLQGYSEEERNVLRKRLSLENAVTSETVPAFIWSTAEDTAVPPENAMRFATALARAGVCFELHVYPHGSHGASTCDFEINFGHQDWLRRNRAWLDDCCKFFRMYVKEPY